MARTSNRVSSGGDGASVTRTAKRPKRSSRLRQTLSAEQKGQTLCLSPKRGVEKCGNEESIRASISAATSGASGLPRTCGDLRFCWFGSIVNHPRVALPDRDESDVLLAMGLRRLRTRVSALRPNFYLSNGGQCDRSVWRRSRSAARRTISLSEAADRLKVACVAFTSSSASTSAPSIRAPSSRVTCF